MAFVGVIGGMGPLATSDFLTKLVKVTAAPNDQSNIPVLVYGDCTAPDRTTFILGKGPSPLPTLLEAVHYLNSHPKVRLICMPCNSAHRWAPEIQAASKVPLVSIVEASAKRALKSVSSGAADGSGGATAMPAGRRKVGLLCTEGTLLSRGYHEGLDRLGVDCLTPSSEEFARLVNPAIAFVKAGDIAAAEPLFAEAAQLLFSRGAESVILGCTEIPLGCVPLLKSEPERYVDSTEALVHAVVEKWREITAAEQAAAAAKS
jgi:aspartate racemase